MSTTNLDQKIDAWKEQLLDLTRRNNMVDFSATKTKSLPTKNDDLIGLADELASGEDLYVWKPEVDDDSDDEDPTETAGETRADDEDTEEDDPENDRPSVELISIRDPETTENSLYNIDLNQRKHVQEKGVDSLYLALGMLEWYSIDHSDTKLRSPLFLASVSIERETVSDPERHDYVISSDDEVIVNPALRKKLRGDHGIELPDDDDVDLPTLSDTKSEIGDAIEGKTRWEIADDVVLGIFDFAKLSLYNDLEEHRERIKSNAIVRALNGDQSALNTDTDGIPTAEELDDAVDPEETFQVLEADSSQQEAIEAAKGGASFVLQGPPGTGKSQTIANIIAEKLAAGEQILFVSEKQAALDVVKNRLDDAGLGRFCLPAHGKKANKDEVLSSLESELNAPQIKSPRDRARKLGELRRKRAELNQYGDLLETTFGDIETTAYEAHGLLAKYDDVPSPRWQCPRPLSVSKDEFRRAVDQLEQLAELDDELDRADSHPWRHTLLDSWQVDITSRTKDTLRAQQSVLDDATAFAERLRSRLGVECMSIDELDEVVEVLELLETRPDVEWERQFFDPEFYDRRERLQSFAEESRQLATARATIDDTYDQSIYQEDPEELHSELSEYGILRYVSPSYRRLKSRILEHADDDYSPDLEALKEDMQTLMEIERLNATLSEYRGMASQLGHLYANLDTDWDRALDVQSWVATVETYDQVDPAALEQLLVGSLEHPAVRELRREAEQLASQWDDAKAFFEETQATERIETTTGQSLYAAPFDETQSKLASLENEVRHLQNWVQFTQARDAARDSFAGDYVDAFLESDIDAEHLVDGFRKEFYTDFLNTIYDQTSLSGFNAGQHEQILEEFQQLDKKQQELAKVEIQHRVTNRRPQMSLEHASSSQQVILRREIEKQRQRKPLRTLFAEAGDMITRLKPCFMMSPLSVAQHLRSDSIDFDVVIFDEASQIMPQDAISSLIRADQAVIAGDTKQLPPTQFFDSDAETSDEVREDLESILDEAAAVLPEKYLRWHYRSRSDELITFSNQKYYGGRLQTFPENEPDVETGVDFEFVEDGIYDRGGSRQNIPEAERVVDIVQEIAATDSEKSVGVVAFSQAQEQAVRDVIEDRRKDDRDLDRFVDEEDALEGFFVKNLESVQGDERDVMLFSVGYGPDQAGKITMNFGPLNNDGGERRLNVAVTRAKERVIMVSSLQPGDIDLSRTDARGVKDFKTYLEYAKKGERALVRDDEPAETLAFDSTFEEAVYDALTERGFDVETQIQSSGYSIDLAIRHPEKPGRYLLGIECDGAAYHSSRTARDRDRTRQMILEDLGWTIHRIWSPDWVSNREGEIAEIERRVEELLDTGELADERTATVEVDETEPEVADESATADGGVGTFQEYSEPELRTKRSRDFDDLSNSRVHNDLVDIVEKHGPIEKDVAYTLLVRQYDISRVGKKIRRSLDGMLPHLDGRKLVRRDGFLWPSSVDEIPVRVNGENGDRSADEVPPEEFAKAAYVILENGLEMIRDDLVLETAKKFGWARRGSTIRSRIEEAIDYLVAIDAVEETDVVSANGVDIDQYIQNDIYG